MARMYQGTAMVTKEQAAEGRRWVVVDAKGQPLGRLATRVAVMLRGKHRPDWTPHVDTGDYVVVVNAGEVSLSGNKLDQKKYYRHSGYPGHLKEITARRMLETRPERVIRLAVRGMLPKTKLGRAMLQKLKVYPGADHPHAAQKPEPVSAG